MNRILVTGSSGLIGSEVCVHFHSLGWQVHGVDANLRAFFFGPKGDTRWNQSRLQRELKNFYHHELDVRDREGVRELVEQLRPKALVHAAAQPSHDLASKLPFDDFDTNAVGTINLLESVRRYCADAVFVYMSTNKVYGDAPNALPLNELQTRWEYARPQDWAGIREDFTIDQSKHSLFGASKVAGDVMVQEYGRYFGMATCCLRGGCLTGPAHSGVELHGFLSYLIRCNVEAIKYTIFGYKGKQVRDNLHSHDVARFIEAFVNRPQSGEVYNLGGGRDNSCSVLEAIRMAESVSGRTMIFEYSDVVRPGDHICYISDLAKMKRHYPEWSVSRNLSTIFEEIHKSWVIRPKQG
jgi:CDP-paratose 2-epimerase